MRPNYIILDSEEVSMKADFRFPQMRWNECAIIVRLVLGATGSLVSSNQADSEGLH